MDKKKILIIEDDQHFVKILHDFLEGYGFNIIYTYNGNGGIELFVKEKPDLLIIDVRLPDISGIEVASRIRMKPDGREIPIIMISAVYRNKTQIQNDTFLYNLNSFLIKPFPLQRLLSEIKDLLRIETPSVEAESERKSTIEKITALPVQGKDSDFLERLTESFVSTFKDLSSAEKPIKEGVLKELTFPTLLKELFEENETGRLFVKKMGLWVEVYFRNGYPIGASSNSSEELLGSILLKKGLISVDDHIKAMEVLKGGEEFHVGEYMLTNKLLTFEQLFMVLKEQIELRILKLFLLQQANYKFFRGDLFKGKYPIKIHPARLIWKGIWEKCDVNIVANYLLKFQEFIIRINPKWTTVWELLPSDKLKFRNLRKEIEGKSLQETLNIWKYNIPDITRMIFLCLTLDMISFIKKEEYEQDVESVEEEASLQLRRTIEEIEDTYIKFLDADYYTILGVERNIPIRELDGIIKKNLERYNPSNFPNSLPPSVYKKLVMIEKMIREAGDTLSDQEKRKEYNLKLKTIEEEENLKRYMKIESENIFKYGRDLLKNKKYEEAEKFLTRAFELDPNSPYILSYLGWAIYKNSEKSGEKGIERAINYLKHALDLKPNFDIPHHFLGLIYMAQNNLEEARNHFFLAVKINPQNKQAEKELQKIYIKLKTIRRKLLDEW